MKPKDWFLVGLRLFGVWMLLECLAEIVSGCEIHFVLITARTTNESACWFHGAVDAIVGVALLFVAPILCDLLDWKTPPANSCVNCGYDLRAANDRCQECGMNIPEKVG